MDQEPSQGEPHDRHLRRRAAEHGMGPGLPGPARPRHEVLRVGGRRQGRSLLAREQAHLRDRSSDGDHGRHGRALLGDHEGPPHGRHRLLQFRRTLRRRAEVRGLGHGDLRGRLAQAGLPPRHGRKGRAGRRRSPLGQDRLGDRGADQEVPPGPPAPRGGDRPGRREPRPLRRHRERPPPGRRAVRRGRRDGVQESQGPRRARHPHRLLPPREPRGVLRGHRGREEGPGGQRRDGAGAPHLRHPGADERHQRAGGAADPQPPGRAVRRGHGHLRRGDAPEEADGRQGEPRDQGRLLRLHHLLRPHLPDGPGPLHRQGQAAVPGSLRGPGVRGRLGAGRRQRRVGSGGPHLRELPLQRGRLRPDLVRRDGGSGDGALRAGAPQEGGRRLRAAVGFRGGPGQGSPR